ncbi:DUF1963 domain-containing protein [Streptomyces sp. ISL-12]|uniref:DUF1963 domain-containing protein n=1 Tax=Streptomyces sp. ISL-12 TaxID=2819177 RepID=UPI001BE6FE34|nr:DUF1963 domain-containing protein [Streptomyces sp. ISL-12]MBT2413019.1 DUF1963 domain-containing protein [Streptomyces sp. ISL-12]
MIDDWNTDRVGRFRAEAASRGLPAEDAEEWIRSLVPGAFFAPDGDGPPLVSMGGHPSLPEGVPAPAYPLVASVDCALLPPDTAGLPLPADGHLLFFADPALDFRGQRGEAVLHVPAGTPTATRRTDSDFGPFEPQELRRMWQHLSPVDTDAFTETRWEDADDEQYELAGELEDAWTHVGGSWPTWTFALGGHPVVRNDDPLLVARDDAPQDADDWIPLATWRCPQEVRELDSGVITWLIRRADLTARRFDRVYGYVDM